MGRAILSFFAACLPLFSQSDAKPLAFEVAEVKVNKSGSGPVSANIVNGQIRLINAPMRLMLSAAYHVRPQEITGAPGWIDAERFDVIAKSKPDTPEDDLRRMLQTLLVERFKLAARMEEKVTSAYALVVGKGALKLKESPPAGPTDNRCSPTDGAPDQIHMLCAHITMRELADGLPNMAPRYIALPVIDKTGIKGTWELRLDWTPMAAPAGRGGDNAPTIETIGGYTMFDAIAKLGLKLENAKLPVPVLVVDHIERIPVDN